MSTRSRKRTAAALVFAVAGMAMGAGVETRAARGIAGRGSNPIVGAGAPPPATFDLRTAAFKPGGDIPKKFTCSGPDVSPGLDWSDPPQGARSFALIMDDPDAPAGIWVHWVVFDLPAATRRLPEGVPQSESVPGGGRQGLNDFQKPGYNGPCPPPGRPHRYFLKLYALDKPLGLDASATKASVEEAMKGHIVARGELMGRFGR